MLAAENLPMPTAPSPFERRRELIRRALAHVGPCSTLHERWAEVYRDWLPGSGQALRDAPPMELCRNSPADTPPERLHTELWLPIG